MELKKGNFKSRLKHFTIGIERKMLTDVMLREGTYARHLKKNK